MGAGQLTIECCRSGMCRSAHGWQMWQIVGEL
jgi:hypothetical protein